MVVPKKSIIKTAKVPENDMGILNNQHYEKQMSVVRTILNLQKKGVDVKDIIIKIRLADSYVIMVLEKGEEKMEKYWRKIYNIKKGYKGV